MVAILNKLILSIGIIPFVVFSMTCNKTLILGLGSTWPPYYYKDGGKISGVDIDIVKNIFSKANICLEYQRYTSSQRGLFELKSGHIDFLFAASYSKEREEFAYFSIPYREETVRIFWRKENHQALIKANFETFINSSLVGVTNKGSFIGVKNTKLLKERKSSIMYTVPSIARRMRMLEHHRVDFTIEDQYSGLYHLQKFPIKSIDMHPLVVFKNEVSLMFSRKSVTKKQLEKINIVISENRDVFEQILKSYL